MFSIDQNCHSLWDALPKLHALARRGHRVRHFIEDVDVAFTCLGARAAGAPEGAPVGDAPLALARERFHPSGGADWGAALFYWEFLGRQPAEIRDWEPLTGMKTAAIARALGRTIDSLYAEFSPADNWQLIGPSYLGDHAHHRVIGDLTVGETAPFLREMLAKAKADMLNAFPETAARGRVEDWFGREEHLVERLLDACAAGRLVDLYRAWLGEHLPETVRLDATSRLLATGADPQQTVLMEIFCRDYDLAAGLYNQAAASAGVGLHPLDTRAGELPFFAVQRRDGRLVRTGAFLRAGALLIGEDAFPLGPGPSLPVQALRAAGVLCLAGKAIVLALQVRLGAGGSALALPYRGSLYMPAAHLLAEALSAHGLLPAPLHPIVRVRFRLLDRMKSLHTTIRLPGHLAESFGAGEVAARWFSEGCADLAAQAARRLDALKDPAGRLRVQREQFPELVRAIDELDARRRSQAESDPDPEKVRPLWKEAKSLKTDLLERTLRLIARDVHVRDVGLYDSRGALWPWCVALGGPGFYEELLSRAEIYEERVPA